LYFGLYCSVYIIIAIAIVNNLDFRQSNKQLQYEHKPLDSNVCVSVHEYIFLGDCFHLLLVEVDIIEESQH